MELALTALMFWGLQGCDEGGGQSDPGRSDATQAGGAGGTGPLDDAAAPPIDGGVPDQQPEPEPEPEPDPFGRLATIEEGGGQCRGTSFQSQRELAIIEDFGLTFQGIDERDPATALIIELRDDRGGRLPPGIYDLGGADLDTCKICVLACAISQGRCSSIYYAREGVIEITERGDDVGEGFGIALHRVRYEQVTIDGATLRTTPVIRGDQWCADGYRATAALLPRAAEVGEPVRDFSLRNCASGEMESLYNLLDPRRGLWIIASAGWCSACRQYLPQAFEAARSVPEDRIKTVVVLGEDASFGPPSLDYCRRYAQTFGEDPSRFYIDHDGREASFATLFTFMWPYVGNQGEFGLPWNAAVRSRDRVYLYGDGYRNQRGAVVDALNTLLRE